VAARIYVKKLLGALPSRPRLAAQNLDLGVKGLTLRVMSFIFRDLLSTFPAKSLSIQVMNCVNRVLRVTFYMQRFTLAVLIAKFRVLLLIFQAINLVTGVTRAIALSVRGVPWLGRIEQPQSSCCPNA